nr:hypothetical protein [Tanacetum cinerariifolium]
MLPAEEQPLPAAVSPTAELPRYITKSEPEKEPEENDGDDENSVSASDETEPFEEGETAATPPPFGYSIRPTLTIAESRRANGKLIGRLRRERRYFRTVATTYAQEVAHSRDYCARIMDYCQSREVHTSTLVTQMEALRREVSTLQRQHIEHAQRDVAPEDGDRCS